MKNRTPNEHRLYRMTLEATEAGCIRTGRTMDPQAAAELAWYRMTPAQRKRTGYPVPPAK